MLLCYPAQHSTGPGWQEALQLPIDQLCHSGKLLNPLGLTFLICKRGH